MKTLTVLATALILVACASNSGMYSSSEDASGPELYLMCDDVHRTVEELRVRGAVFVRPVADQGFGLVTAIRLPGGGELGLYQPKHPVALGLRSGTP